MTPLDQQCRYDYMRAAVVDVGHQSSATAGYSSATTVVQSVGASHDIFKELDRIAL